MSELAAMTGFCFFIGLFVWVVFKVTFRPENKQQAYTAKIIRQYFELQCAADEVIKSYENRNMGQVINAIEALKKVPRA